MSITRTLLLSTVFILSFAVSSCGYICKTHCLEYTDVLI